MSPRILETVPPGYLESASETKEEEEEMTEGRFDVSLRNACSEVGVHPFLSLHLRRDGTVPLTHNQQRRGGRNAVVRIKTECGYDIVVHRGVGHAETRVPNVKKKRM